MTRMLVKPKGGDIGALLKQIGIDAKDGNLGGLMRPNQEELALAESLGDHIRLLFPNAPNKTIAELDAIVDARIEGHFAYFAGSFVALQHALSKLPNCSVSLYPAGGPSFSTTSGTVYPLYPSASGVSTGKFFQFTRGMWFGSLTTSIADAANGFFFVGSSVKFSDDIVSSMPNDVSFLAFESDLVFARTQLGVYAQRAFLSPIDFDISIAQVSGGAKVLVNGVLLKYRDERCYQGELADDMNAIFEPMADGRSYANAIRELIATRAQRYRRPARSVGGLSFLGDRE